MIDFILKRYVYWWYHPCRAWIRIRHIKSLSGIPTSKCPRCGHVNFIAPVTKETRNQYETWRKR